MTRASLATRLLAFALAGGAAVACALASTEDKAAREGELGRITEELRLGRVRVEALEREVEALKADRAKLAQSVIDAASRVQMREAEATAAEERLARLQANEEGIRLSLASRREALAELLAAMQRIGRAPPPALLVTPGDALSAVRAALLLGSVLPELRTEAESLASDLHQLVTLAKRMALERDTIAREVASLAQERDRLALLLEERKRTEAVSAHRLAEERKRIDALAATARSLEELIARLERQGEAQAAEEPGTAAVARAGWNGPQGAGRLQPAVTFAAAQGRLKLPASGVRLRGFGDADGFGGISQGLSIATRAGAQVTAPSDGWVVYSGRFRSYRQLLIIDAGDGYHLLLAGMERIHVDSGQFVLAGEPVAVMGGTPTGSKTAIAPDAKQPILYVEFRKDGAAIDSAPWWAIKEIEKVRG